MTFEQALLAKQHYPNPYCCDGMEMTLYIVPATDRYMKQYIEYYKRNDVTDYTAKQFSKDNEYRVYALYKVKDNVISIEP